MYILGIESSCDETSVAVVRYNREGMVGEILSSCTYSQADIHAVFGGVVPEVASRNHMLKIAPLYHEALEISGISQKEIDLIAVTAAPGLIGALFVGVSFAKGLSFSLGKPIIPVHHLAGHILSAEIGNNIRPPYIALVASGGHTHIYKVTDSQLHFELWGRTIDDAAGEAFDKVSKMLGGPYPGGPYIEKLALAGDEHAIKFPVALRDKNDFSFSGLKTAVLTKIKEGGSSKEDIAASFQYTVGVTLAQKAVRAASECRLDTIVFAGGVACNERIRDVLKLVAAESGIAVYFPKKELCNDNGAMIAYAGARIYSGKDDVAEFYDLTFAAGDTKHEIETNY